MSLDEIRAALEGHGPSEPIALRDAETFLPMRWEDERWQAAGPHADLAMTTPDISAVVRAVLALPWPFTLETEEDGLQIVSGASEQYELTGDEGRHLLRIFAHKNDHHVQYALDLLDPAQDATALTVWRLDDGATSIAPEQSLGELLGIGD